LACALVAAAFVLRSSSSAEPTTTVPPASHAPSSAFPSPPPGATVYARQRGAEALALAVVPKERQLLLQASAVGQQGQGISGLDVRFTVAGSTRTAAACGAGCYRATMGLSERPTDVAVGVGGSTWSVPLPAAWPPKDASRLVAGAGRAWRRLRSLAFTETLASSSTNRITSTWRVQAPDRLTYTVRNGWSGIVVGRRRWDRGPSSSTWVESTQSPVTQPVPPWTDVADAHLLGRGTVSGRPVWRVSFFDPVARAWFTLALDRRTLRTLDSRMIATGHFMHDVYGSFDAATPVSAP
jgi:hypothetical protein